MQNTEILASVTTHIHSLFVLHPRLCCSATVTWSNTPSDSGSGAGCSRAPRRRMKRWSMKDPGHLLTWERLISEHWINCCIESVNQSNPFIKVHQSNWYKLIYDLKMLWHVFIFWNYFIEWLLIYFLTLFIREELCKYMFCMCHILLSIVIIFIAGLDVFFDA